MTAIYFSLSNTIEHHKFLHKVEQLIFKQKDLKNKILRVDIVEINQECNEAIPKIEFLENK